MTGRQRISRYDRPGLRCVPGGGDVDQVVRWEAFKAANPSAEWAHNAPLYTGSVAVRGGPVTRAATSLEGIIDELGKVVESAAMAPAEGDAR